MAVLYQDDGCSARSGLLRLTRRAGPRHAGTDHLEGHCPCPRSRILERIRLEHLLRLLARQCLSVDTCHLDHVVYHWGAVVSGQRRMDERVKVVGSHT